MGAATPARRAAAVAPVRAAAEAYEGDLVGTGMKFGVVVGRFNDLVTKLLLDGAMGAFKRHGVAEADVDVSPAGSQAAGICREACRLKLRNGQQWGRKSCAPAAASDTRSAGQR